MVPPVITEPHRERILDYIQSARDEGATIATGGGIPADQPEGWYVEPTLITTPPTTCASPRRRSSVR